MGHARSIAIIGAGPAGLIAAEMLASAGHAVQIYDRMPSPARKLLIAGRGGLNLTHSEPLDLFLTRYGDAAAWLAPYIRAFTPQHVRDWCEGLGELTFIGSSGRVFPERMKASALLRAWLRRLEGLGVRYYPRHTWLGWQGSAHRFATPQGDVVVTADATLLALGGASWPKLGSDGGWVPLLQAAGVPVTPLMPANCGFTVHWSDVMRERFAGAPLKPLAITHKGVCKQGEAMITAQGIEGGLMYAFSASLRDAITRDGAAHIRLDLRPNMSVAALQKKLGARGSKSQSAWLKAAGFSPLAVALIHETIGAVNDAAQLKALPLALIGTTGMARAISSAGGVARDGVHDALMLRAVPGTFVAGEMLDWEAPTGGYLLQACYSTGIAAAHGMQAYLKTLT